MCGTAAQSVLFQLDASTVDSQFGLNVVALDDLDGDGVREFAVSAYNDGLVSPSRGSVSVYSGATRQLRYRVDGAWNYDGLGIRLVAVDDLDGDGLSDLLVTAGFPPQNSRYFGRVEVRSGASGALLYSVTAAAAGNNVNTLGETIGSLGDVDADGRGDFFVYVSESGAGRIHIYSGATGAFLRQHVGVTTNFGRAAASIADQNGDGVRDIAIGDPSYIQYSPAVRGQVLVVSGLNGTLLRTHFGDSTSYSFPLTLADPGDVDRDGVGDLALAIGRSNLGNEVRLLSGANGAPLRLYPSREIDDGFGTWLSNAGDVDGDGFVDLAVGAPLNSGGLVHAGAAYVMSGATGRDLLVATSGELNRYFGSSVAGIGDVDGDGRDDVLVGSPSSRIPPQLSYVRAFGIENTDVTFEFDVDDDFVTPLENGRAVGSGARFGRFIHLLGMGPGHFGPAAFDSSPMGPNASGPSAHLLADSGNVVLLQATSQQTVPGIFDVPSAFAGGGTIVVELLRASRPISIDLVGLDIGANGGANVQLFDTNNRTRSYQVDVGYTGSVAAGMGRRTLDLQTLIRQLGVQGAATVTESVGFDSDEVRRIEVTFVGSGAIDSLRLRPLPQEVVLRQLWRIEDPSSPGFYTFGSILRAAGDLDGDGRGDLLVAESAAAMPFVQVRSGHDGSILRTISGPIGFVSDVLGELDLDGDSVPDSVVGGFRESTAALPSSGAARAYSGATGALLWLRRGLAGEASAGTLVAMGDLDGDGRDDLALAPYTTTGSPYLVRIVSGASGALIRSIALPAAASHPGAAFGPGLDFDLDGALDLILGLPGLNSAGPGASRIQVYSGATGALLVERFSQAPETLLGIRVAGLNDLDGDGRGELFIGSYVPGIGFVTRIVSGLDLTTPLFSFNGLGEVIGDVDGDGARDFVASRVMVGSTGQVEYNRDCLSGRDGTRIVLARASFADRFDHAADAGDTNGDGLDDIAWSRTIPNNTTRYAVEVHTLDRQNGATVCFGTTNSTGVRAQLRTMGSFRIVSNSMSLVATDIPSGNPTLLLSSAIFGRVPFPVISGVASEGNLCVAGGHVTRHATRLAVGSTATFPLDLTALPTIEAPGFLRAAAVGESRFWQCWYRDQGAPGRSNFSDAIQVTFE